MMWKNKNAKIIGDVLLVVFAIISVARMFYQKNDNKEMAEVLNWVILSIVIALVLLKLIDYFFPKWLKNRPTREELE